MALTRCTGCGKSYRNTGLSHCSPECKKAEKAGPRPYVRPKGSRKR